ncbi:GNAT family N-acetyltransferase [Leptolyngbya sp. DQ-M1]|uniref:GNAT family N-acetyltransferase n=1 Tax=Leptolyngbya sp. DQ-M1 TaxID=2933920 RepID=UPI00329A0383
MSFELLQLETHNFMFEIRPATPADVPEIFALIQALAEYEKLSHQVTGSIDHLHNHLFGEKPYVEALVAIVENKAIGFALFLHNYSTFLTKPGIYLEDLFVRPDYRGWGIGKALLTELAGIAVARGCGRLEWSVLDWNESAIGFYKRMGATVLPDWRICRVTGEALTHMATSSS